jgi:predicted dehydrogenase
LIPAFQQIQHSRLVALYKRDPVQAQKTAKEFGIAAGYGDFSDLLKDPQVEAVYITSANGDHEWQAIAAAQAGKHVLCEKPLAPTAAACRNIIESCRHAKIKLMVAHTLRFSPAVIQMKQWIDEGRVGNIRLAQALFTYDGTKSPRRWLYDHKIAGGGALMDVGVHCIDTLRFLLGEVSQYSGIIEPITELVEQTALVSLRFASGALGGVFCSYQSPYRSRLEILGDKGWAWVDSFTLPWTEVPVHLETSAEIVDLKIATGNPYGALLDSFSQAIRDLGPNAIPGEEGFTNQTIIDGIYSQRKIQWTV